MVMARVVTSPASASSSSPGSFAATSSALAPQLRHRLRKKSRYAAGPRTAAAPALAGQHTPGVQTIPLDLPAFAFPFSLAVAPGGR